MARKQIRETTTTMKRNEKRIAVQHKRDQQTWIRKGGNNSAETSGPRSLFSVLKNRSPYFSIAETLLICLLCFFFQITNEIATYRTQQVKAIDLYTRILQVGRLGVEQSDPLVHELYSSESIKPDRMARQQHFTYIYIYLLSTAYGI